MQIYAGRRRDFNKGYWISFENHPRLAETKKNIYARCLPCLERLYEQLAGSPAALILENPLTCWKVVVVFKDLDECLAFLCLYEAEATRRGAAGTVRGRIGTGDKSSPNVVVIFQAQSAGERDALLAEAGALAPRINPDCAISFERGCGDIYGSLCGDWRDWKEVTPVQNPRLVPLIREKVAKLLKGEF